MHCLSLISLPPIHLNVEVYCRKRVTSYTRQFMKRLGQLNRTKTPLCKVVAAPRTENSLCAGSRLHLIARGQHTRLDLMRIRQQRRGSLALSFSSAARAGHRRACESIPADPQTERASFAFGFPSDHLIVIGKGKKQSAKMIAVASASIMRTGPRRSSSLITGGCGNFKMMSRRNA
ncbi:hypothetical protein PYK22_00055 [Pyrinomonas methylaliphatogenes]|uniref:Uncharacterized protein n=1 Tax=Pyrinomonas methylaliphatogenes TaxID=454194 RepID=A0A0B6WS87_9BACT|nr:hypothetical protein PYK22_00055 [Pyrinomonas methylaliphatogenes]